MRILLIGSGAREHAILNSLLSEDAEHEVIVAPGNPGMNAERVEINILNPLEVADLASRRNVDLVVIGPEAPLAAGAVDAVSQLGIPAFGPARAAAQLESSKAFAKQIMQQAGVPTGEAIRATTLDEVENALNSFGAPFVVKADGLNAGKGVLVTNDFQAALDHARLHLKDGAVLIEEFLDGKEVSLFIVTDGVEAVALAPAQDFKRVGDNDSGPNTGGMGAYSPLPWLEPNFTSQVLNDVAIPVIRTMSNVGIPFSGLLYCGLIITKTGVKVIEFNVRFGDPETQVVLARLESPLSELLLAAATGALSSVQAPRFSSLDAVCVVLASEGYPESPITGRKIEGLEEAANAGAQILHAATTQQGNDLLANGGRVLSVVATGKTFAQARETAYHAISRIQLQGSHYRSDIASGVDS